MKHTEDGRTENEKNRLNDDIEFLLWNESYNCPIPRVVE